MFIQQRGVQMLLRIRIEEKLPPTHILAIPNGVPPVCWHCSKRYITIEDMDSMNFGKGLNPVQKLGSPLFQEFSRHVVSLSSGRSYHYWCFVVKFAEELTRKMKLEKLKKQLI